MPIPIHKSITVVVLFPFLYSFIKKYIQSIPNNNNDTLIISPIFFISKNGNVIDIILSLEVLIMKRFMSLIIIISIVMSIIVPVSFADNEQEGEYITISTPNGEFVKVTGSYSTDSGNFWDQCIQGLVNSANGYSVSTEWGSIPISRIIANLSAEACGDPNSPDGKHHADSVLVDPDHPSTGGLCQCMYCGQLFGISGSDARTAYHNAIGDLGLQNMTKNADGSLVWHLTWDPMFASSASWFGIYFRKSGSSSSYYRAYIRNDSSFPVQFSDSFGAVSHFYLDKNSCTSVIDSNSPWFIDCFSFSFKFLHSFKSF